MTEQQNGFEMKILEKVYVRMRSPATILLFNCGRQSKNYHEEKGFSLTYLLIDCHF